MRQFSQALRDLGSKQQKPDLVIAIAHMGAGGAQRVASLLANHWQSRGVRIIVLTLYDKPEAHVLHPGIVREHFSAETQRRQKRPRLVPNKESINRLRRFIRRRLPFGLQRLLPPPEVNQESLGGRNQQRVDWLRLRLRAWRPRVVVSFLGSTNVQTLLAARGLGLTIVISERNDPALEDLGEPWEKLRPQVYREAALTTANSVGALAAMRRYVPDEKLRLVLNPLNTPSCRDHNHRRRRRVLFVGRLVHQKAPEVLLKAFARVAAGSEWHLDIAGEGPMRADLEVLSADLGISGKTTFHGHCSDPYRLYDAANIFVLPSRFEGMPNAMLEAMDCGMAVVVTNASPGPLEHVRHEETGLVVKADDVGELAASLRRLMDDEALRKRLGSSAAEQTKSMALGHVAKVWEDLFGELGIELSSD